MKKRVIALLTAVALTAACMVPAFAAEEKESEPALDKISIEFRVGNSVLKINGRDQKVTTPYEVDGTTLVPLRVITEAFGADVDWDEAEEMVTLNYEGVEIKIWIGRKESRVNGQKLTLLQAPELTDDTTMVPLRFITENFGADVTYDSETEGITVEKVVTQSNSVVDFSQVLHNTTKEYVGDSYLGWSMKYNKNLRLSYREFAGILNQFVTDGEDVSVLVSILDLENEDTIGTIYDNLRKESNQYTVIEQEKRKDQGNKEYLYFEQKSADTYIIDKIYVKNDKLYRCTAYIDLDSIAEQKEAYLEVVNSFDTQFSSASQVEDLSDAEDGFRTYQNKALKFQVDVPADWNDISNKDVSNVYEFFNRNSELFRQEVLAITVVSLSSTSVEKWAKQDRDKNAAEFNPESYTVSEVQDTVVAGQNAKYYIASQELDDGTVWTKKDVFLSLGDYAYNICTQTVAAEHNLEVSDRIFNSFKIEPLDKEVVGKLMIPDDQKEGTQKVKNEDFNYTFEIPSTWKYSMNNDGSFIQCTNNVYAVTVASMDSYYANSGSVLRYALDKLKEEYKDLKVIRENELVALGDKKGYTYEVEITKNGQTVIMKDFAFTLYNTTIVLSLITEKELYGERVQTIMADIASSFVQN